MMKRAAGIRHWTERFGIALIGGVFLWTQLRIHAVTAQNEGLISQSESLKQQIKQQQDINDGVVQETAQQDTDGKNGLLEGK